MIGFTLGRNGKTLMSLLDERSECHCLWIIRGLSQCPYGTSAFAAQKFPETVTMPFAIQFKKSRYFFRALETLFGTMDAWNVDD